MTESKEEISDLQGMSAEFQELLEATGVENLMTLAESDAQILLSEMEQANGMLGLTSGIPEVAVIQSWVEQSRARLNYYPKEEVHRLEPIEESQVKKRRPALHAIPIPPKHMVKQQISVDQIPPMDSFVEEDEEEEVLEHVELPEGSQDLPRIGALPPVQAASKVAGPQVVQIEPKARVDAEITPTPVEEREKSPIQPLVSDITDIRKAPSTGLNAGKTPHSRGYIRGVLHPQPFRIRIAAILTVFTMVMLPASFAAGALLLLQYPVEIAWIPAGFLVIALLYLMFARGMNCRICGQPIYAPKACRKHVKAHHIRFLGYILPTCIHVLLFKWFRCIYCGTSVRVKE